MAEPTERIAILLELEKEKFERNAKTAGAAVDRLERKFNPLAAAEVKLEKQQLRLNNALKAGTLDAKRHATGMELLQREYDQTAAKLNGARNNVVAMNGAVASQAGFMTKNRHVFQQAGYQVGDFAVQVQGGQSALVAFSQQGSQLLGVFGPWGAVMGAALAVGSSLAGVLWNMGDASDEVKEKAKTFTDRLNDAESAITSMAGSADIASAGGLERLRNKFGEVTDEVKDMAIALFEIDKRDAMSKVAGIIGEVTAEIAKAVEASSGVVSSSLARSGTDAAKNEAAAYRAEIESIQTNIEQRKSAGFLINPSELSLLSEMREELAAMEGDLANIGGLASEINIPPELLANLSQAQESLEAASDASDFTGVADQLGNLRDLLVEAGETVSQKVVDGVTQAEKVAREMAARLKEGEEAAVDLANTDITSAIAGGADEAARMAKNFRISLALAQKITRQGYNTKVGGGRGGDPRDFGGSISDIQTNNPGAQLAASDDAVETAAIAAAKKRARKGGKSKPKPELFSIADGELKKLERQIELLGKSKAEVAALTTKHKLLDEAKKRGIAITAELSQKIDAEAEQVGQLADQYENARDKMAAIENIQKQFKDGIIDAAMGGENAMDAFTDSIKRAALEYALFGSGMFAPKGGGGFGGIFGGLMGGGNATGGGFLSGLIPGFANGTNNAPGGLATINERGGELVNLPNGSQVIPHDLSKRIVDRSNGQSQGGVTVVQHNTFGNGVNRSEINAMIPKIIETTKAAVMDGKRRGGAYGRAFS